ncbi:MAG: cell division protein FtsK [Flavobacteriales bacterium]|nr:MAG: cell division protein FtsK [Flavobacteriales bacterium]
MLFWKKKSKSVTLKAKKKKKFNLFLPFKKWKDRWTERFQNEKIQQVTGLSSLLFSAYLLLSFTSYLFTWKIDQDKLLNEWSELLSNSEIIVVNWLGKFGALVSHQFIHNWFGIASFIFVLLFFLTGFRMLFKINLLPLRKTLKYSFFAIIWISISLGYMFDKSYFFLGGNFGYTVNLWLGGTLGSIGTGLIITFALLAFLIVSFDFSMQWLFDFFQNSKEELLKQETETNEEEITAPVAVAKEESTVVSNPLTELPQKEKAEEDASIDLGTVVPITKSEKQKDEDVELSIEEAVDNDDTLSKNELKDKITEFGEYDPTLDLAKFQLPHTDLLNDYGDGSVSVDREELEANKDRIVETLSNYNIGIEKIKATIGPTVTLYEIVPAKGVRISKIKNLEDDIALSLSALGIRIIAPIPGKGTIGIEVPNQNPEIVGMRTLLSSEKFQNTEMELPVALGKTIANETYIADLSKMPHLLMAGATGQGKSVGLNAILVSLLYKKHPSQIKFVLVDPKKVELTLFNKIERHYLAKLPDSEEAIVTDTKKVVHTLNSLCIEMEQRYDLLKTALVRNIKEYNVKFIARKLNPNNGHRFLPYIILVVDEFADLIMTAGKEVESPITRLAQLARAIGIHLIIATQRPSVNIITGTIKANFPTRMAFRVTAKVDSRTILDAGGAEQLIGRGDMLLAIGSEIIRLQCAFVDTPEVEQITTYIGDQKAYPDAFLLPEYVDESASGHTGLNDEERDVMFEDAARIVVQHQQGSASLLQRRLKLGYNRAGRIVDQLESAGIIGPFEGSKARHVLIPDEYSLEQFLNGNEETVEEPVNEIGKVNTEVE